MSDAADAPTADLPAEAAVRYRCTACGNLTRFDVTTTRRVRAYHHFTVGGELSVEDPEVLSESVDEVLCRWCGTGSTVVVLEPGDDVPSAGPDRADPGS
jgi:hypothetical protein